MIKLADTTDNVFVTLTKAEFKSLAKTGAVNVADGAAVDISWISKITAFSAGNSKALADAKAQADTLSTTLQGLIANAGS